MYGGGPFVQNHVSGLSKGGSVELLHAVQPWIVDTNAVWSGNGIRRYNRGIVRWPANWTSTSIQFDVMSTPLSFSDGLFSVMVDGAIAATVVNTTPSIPQRFYITGLPIAGGGSTVEVWEPWNGKPGAQNTGADGQVEGGLVTAVYLPASTPLTAPVCSTGIICVGDSISGAYVTKDSVNPQGLWGPGGQLRLLAQAKGWLYTSLDYGGACLLGDGLTAANFITWINQARAAMGSPATVKVLYLPFRNDWADYGAAGVSSTPTACGTLLQTIISGLSDCQHIVCTNIPQADESANGGGFTLPNYRTAEAAVTGATILSGTSFGIGTDASWLPDGIHLSRTKGVPAYVAGVKGALGL